MEAFMPGIVALTTGVLAAGSTGLLLSGEDAGAKSSSKPGGGHAAWDWLASTCRAVGGPLRSTCCASRRFGPPCESFGKGG